MDVSTEHMLDFHLHNMILLGVSAPGVNPCYEDLVDRTRKRFRRLAFMLEGCRYDTVYRHPADTPYLLQGNDIFYDGVFLSGFPVEPVRGCEEEWDSERSWWFKEVAALGKYYDLRLNPVNWCANLKHRTGSSHEFRGCVFCHRCYGEPRITERRTIVSPKEIFREIFRDHGSNVLKEVTKVLLNTGDTQSERQMMSLVEDIYFNYLISNGFEGVFSAVTTLIRSEHGIRRLSEVDNTLFEFPIECFTRREMILGEKKGIPMPQVWGVLSVARKYFKYIRVNLVVGLDDLNSFRQAVEQMAHLHLVDDIVSNIFVPSTPDAVMYRHQDCGSVDYLYRVREILEQYGFTPKKAGVTKDLFSSIERRDLRDGLVS